MKPDRYAIYPKQCVGLGLPCPEPEHRFHPVRRWRFDFCWSDHKLAVEIEGGAWVQGRHNRGASFIKDMEKYNNAAILGWSLLRFTPQQVKSGEAARVTAEWFTERGLV